MITFPLLRRKKLKQSKNYDMNTKAFLIYGSTGAGKSTYSQELIKQDNTYHLSIDEWMKNLFWKDVPSENTLDWALERVERCETQIWSIASRLLSSGNSVVFDLGFSKKAQREKFKKLLRSINCEFETHFLDIDVDIRWERVNKRNSQKLDSYQLEVTRETFDWMETYFEKPELEEMVNPKIFKDSLSLKI